LQLSSIGLTERIFSVEGVDAALFLICGISAFAADVLFSPSLLPTLTLLQKIHVDFPDYPVRPTVQKSLYNLVL
jgi:hypothetical protein